MAKYRSGLGFIIGIVVVFLLYLSSPAPVYRPAGVFLPATDMPRLQPQIPSSVSFLPKQAGWGAEQRLGWVSVELHDPSASANKRQELEAELRMLAAHVGGNAILLSSLFNTGQYGASSSQASWQGSGEVVFIPPRTT